MCTSTKTIPSIAADRLSRGGHALRRHGVLAIAATLAAATPELARGGSDPATPAATDAAGNVYVAARAGRDGGMAMAKHDPAGSVVWRAVFPAPVAGATVTPVATGLDAAGAVYVAFGIGLDGAGGDLWAMRLNGDTGRIQWISRHEGGVREAAWPREGVVDAAGDVYVTGERLRHDTLSFVTVKFDADGTVECVRLHGPSSLHPAEGQQ